jgi:hypothetical protein
MLSRYRAAVIPHAAQRYNTVGDYYYPHSDELQVRISDLKNTDYEFLILIHELVEAYLCQKRGIPEPEIAAWDIEHPALVDPGASVEAPYHKEHMFATSIEHQISKELEVDWDKYDEAINSLCEVGQGPDPEQGLEQPSDVSSTKR